MNQIEYGDKLIRLGKLMKNSKTKLKDLVAAALDCGLVYTFGLTPRPEASVELDLGKPDVPLTVATATRLARLAVEMEDIAALMRACGEEQHWSDHAAELCGAAGMATEWSKEMIDAVRSDKGNVVEVSEADVHEPS